MNISRAPPPRASEFEEESLKVLKKIDEQFSGLKTLVSERAPILIAPLLII